MSRSHGPILQNKKSLTCYVYDAFSKLGIAASTIAIDGLVVLQQYENPSPTKR